MRNGSGEVSGKWLVLLSAIGVALVIGLWTPSGPEGGVFVKTAYSIRASFLFTTAALVCRAFDKRPGVLEYWRVLKTGGLIFYLLHFYYTVGVIYGGSLEAVYRAQGVVIASGNLALTLAWTIEVLATAWRGEPQSPPWRAAQGALYLVVFLSFIAASVVLRGGAVRLLGIACAVLVAGVWAARRVAR